MAIAHRTFSSYAEYVRLQGGKARGQRAALLAEVPKRVKQYGAAFAAAAPFLHAGPVLCLGARSGAEVIAASRAGFTGSVGIDLHPVGPDVLQADWHALPFADASFANIYSNSLDHCLFLDRLAAEIRRVLTPDGVFYLMASDKGRKTSAAADAWLKKRTSNEALYWQQSDDLCAAVVGHGFQVETAWRTKIWGHYILRACR